MRVLGKLMSPPMSAGASVGCSALALLREVTERQRGAVAVGVREGVYTVVINMDIEVKYASRYICLHNCTLNVTTYLLYTPF